MKRHDTLYALAALALGLGACGPQSSNDGSDDEWCVDQSCDADPEGQDDQVDEPEPDDHDENDDTDHPDHGGDDPTDPDDAPVLVGPDDEPDVPDDPEPEERPWTIDPPTVTARPSSLAVHEGTACGVYDGYVTCWGENDRGQAQPPEGLYAQKVVLASDFGCALNGPLPITCWGDGADRIAAREQATIVGRHTIWDASASEDVLCYTTGYTLASTYIECANETELWTMGDTRAMGIDVQAEPGPRSERAYCYIQRDDAVPNEPRYTYLCENYGRFVRIPADGEYVAGSLPQLRHDGDGGVTIVDAKQQLSRWYFDTYLLTQGPLGVRGEATPMDLDTSEIENTVGQIDSLELVSPNCVFANSYFLMCDGGSSEGFRFIVRQSSIVAVHEYPYTNEISYCFGNGYSDSEGNSTPECATVRR